MVFLDDAVLPVKFFLHATAALYAGYRNRRTCLPTFGTRARFLAQHIRNCGLSIAGRCSDAASPSQTFDQGLLVAARCLRRFDVFLETSPEAGIRLRLPRQRFPFVRHPLRCRARLDVGLDDCWFTIGCWASDFGSHSGIPCALGWQLAWLDKGQQPPHLTRSRPEGSQVQLLSIVSFWLLELAGARDPIRLLLLPRGALGVDGCSRCLWWCCACSTALIA